jgi:hypothetical protein
MVRLWKNSPKNNTAIYQIFFSVLSIMITHQAENPAENEGSISFYELICLNIILLH